MKKMISMVLAVVMLAALAIPSLAVDSSYQTIFNDLEDFESTDDMIFNWFVQPSNEKCGDIILDTDAKLHGQNSLLFDYSMKGAQSTGKAWCTFNFTPDDPETKFADGVKFSAVSDSHIMARIVICDENYYFKQYFFDVTTEPQDYTVRWEDFQMIPGQRTWDPATSTWVTSMDIALIADYQPEDFDGEGKFWFDDFYTFAGDDVTAVKPLDRSKDITPTAPTTTTKQQDTTTSSDGTGDTTATEKPDDSTTKANTTTTTKAGATTATTAAGTQPEEQSGNAWIFIVIGVVVVAGAGVAVFFVLKNKKKSA